MKGVFFRLCLGLRDKKTTRIPLIFLAGVALGCLKNSYCSWWLDHPFEKYAGHIGSYLDHLPRDRASGGWIETVSNLSNLSNHHLDKFKGYRTSVSSQYTKGFDQFVTFANQSILPQFPIMRYPHWLHLLYILHGTFTWVQWQENCPDYLTWFEKTQWQWTPLHAELPLVDSKHSTLTWIDPESCSGTVPPNIIQPHTKSTSKKTLSSSRPVEHAQWPTSWWHSIGSYWLVHTDPWTGCFESIYNWELFMRNNQACCETSTTQKWIRLPLHPTCFFDYQETSSSNVIPGKIG